MNDEHGRHGREGEGLSFGKIDDKEAKRRQQAEYARALQMDETQQGDGQGRGRGREKSGLHSNAMPIGHVEDADSKRRKQEQYAAELRQQQQQISYHGGDNSR